MSEGQSAWVLRIAPGRIDRVEEALSSDQIIIGWAAAEGLLNPDLSGEAFREILSQAFYSSEPDLRRAGAAAGHMSRFIRDMKTGDLVVVPHPGSFYVGEIAGPATYDASKVDEDSAYRRPVRWRNEKKPIPRRMAQAALIARMKNQGTCVEATDLLPQIKRCLELAPSRELPSFHEELQAKLVEGALAELQHGRMDPNRFERLIESVLKDLGAANTRIISKQNDKGADIVATFLVAGTFQQKIAVQAKHWRPDPPVGREVVEQLIRGIEAEEANLGAVITSGSISEEATRAAEEYFDEKGIAIELVDGEQFAKLIVENGIRAR